MRITPHETDAGQHPGSADPIPESLRGGTSESLSARWAAENRYAIAEGTRQLNDAANRLADNVERLRAKLTEHCDRPPAVWIAHEAIPEDVAQAAREEYEADGRMRLLGVVLMAASAACVVGGLVGLVIWIAR